LSKRLTGGLAAAALALTMFAAGTLGPLQPEVSRPAPRAAVADATLAVTAKESALDRSIAALQRALSSSDGNWRQQASLGLAYLTKARVSADPSFYPKAAGLLRASLRTHPRGNFQARVGLGVLAAARHDFAAALRWGRAALAINAYSADALAIISDALVELGRYDVAERTLQRMVDLRPSLASYARVAYLRELHGDVAGAIVAMRTALDLAGAGPDAAWAAYQLGELFFNSGELAAATREYRKSNYLAPGFPLAHVGLAKIAAARGELDRATDTLSRIARVYPTPEVVILLGDLYEAAGNRERARAQYELVEAIAALARANGVNTDLEVALFQADHGKAASALTRVRAEWTRRRSVHVADALAWALYAAGRDEEAMRASRLSLRLGTRSALFHFHAGMIAGRLGRVAESRRHLVRSLRINPHFSFLHADTARRTLARIESGT
jgi:tetratricopeptide (TPR) repeat protein